MVTKSGYDPIIAEHSFSSLPMKSSGTVIVAKTGKLCVLSLRPDAPLPQASNFLSTKIRQVVELSIAAVPFHIKTNGFLLLSKFGINHPPANFFAG